MAKKQEELQHLSFLGIFKESFNIISSQPKIFIQITLFFILPISCIGIAINIGFANSLDHVNNLFANALLSASTNLPPPYNETPKSNWLSWKVAFYVISFLAYMALSFVFLILYVSTAVYTTVCIKTGKDISFRKAVSIVPRVWKQVICTHLCTLGINLAIFFVYFLVFALIMIGFTTLMMSSKTNNSHKLIFGIPLSIGLLIVSILYVVVIFYTAFIWLLGDIVSVLEKIRGIKALKKSKTLVKGKMGTVICVYLGMLLCTIPSVVFLMKMKNITNEGKVWEKVCFGILGLVFSSFSSIFTLVVRSVLYMVCKSYHHEPIDKLSSIGYMEISHEDHLPFKKMMDKPVEDLGV